MNLNNVSADDLQKSNPNKHIYRIENNKIGNIILDDVQHNVLTHIFVKDEYRGNGLSRNMIKMWLRECYDDKGYSEAYIVGIRSNAVVHVIKTLNRYKCEKVEITDVPGNIKLGNTVEDLHYKIVRK